MDEIRVTRLGTKRAGQRFDRSCETRLIGDEAARRNRLAVVAFGGLGTSNEGRRASCIIGVQGHSEFSMGNVTSKAKVEASASVKWRRRARFVRSRTREILK